MIRLHLFFGMATRSLGVSEGHQIRQRGSRARRQDRPLVRGQRPVRARVGLNRSGRRLYRQWPLAGRPASGSLRRCVQAPKAPHIAREAVDAAARSWHILNGSPTKIRKHLQEEQIRTEPNPSKSPRFLEMTTDREDVA